MALKPGDPNLKMSSEQYAALEKKYAELSAGCAAWSAECRAAAEKNETPPALIRDSERLRIRKTSATEGRDHS